METETLFKDALAGIFSAKLELRKIAQRLSRHDRTILHIASKDGSLEQVRYILKEFADNNILMKLDSNQETALHLAAFYGHTEVVKLLIEAAQCLLPASGDVSFETFVRQPNTSRNTALHLAVANGSLGCARLLVEADKEDRHIPNCQGEPPVYLAAKLGYNKIVKMICETCTAPSLSGPDDGSTALHAAIKMLPRGRTPLHYAAFHKFDSVLAGIIEKQKLVGYQSVYGYQVPTPLCVAATEGHISTVKQLMTLLPWSCSQANHQGQNILHIAAFNRNKEMVRCILKYCPKDCINKIINDKDENGDTPLHLLISQGCFVPELINHKEADTLARNNQNWTPFDMLYSQDRVKGDQESLVPPIIRSRKEAKFKRAKKRVMKEELEVYRTRTNTQIIVTALITTVTFTVGFTLPGGYHQSGEDDQGLAVLSKKSLFTAFMVTDAVALLLSTSSLFLYFISTMYQTPHRVSQLNAASTGLNIISIITMMLTFLTGSYLVLSDSPALAVSVCVIICLFFLLVIVLSILMLYDRKKEKDDEV
ncbi:hypothetical protein DCAR_0309944 [Daucus carota subsp. sativus]|uniref:PGG domain-containing protein n=1 Tax=Daucus carota subsp. sativus TaxID=79200 RepID=A0AAF0WMK3_DAUCS|nr:hypothetical protein DCAR_0309944 [Daucus carota subsp. sativus]